MEAAAEKKAIPQGAEKLFSLLTKAANELDAWVSARPDLAGETPALVKEIETELEKFHPHDEQSNNV